MYKVSPLTTQRTCSLLIFKVFYNSGETRTPMLACGPTKLVLKLNYSDRKDHKRLL